MKNIRKQIILLSTAILPVSLQFRSDMILNTLKPIFHQIWITMENIVREMGPRLLNTREYE